jgi:hypothetical protein
MAEPSTRAKWRALRSARSSTLKTCLTPPTLSETPVYNNNHRTTRLAATISGCREMVSALATSSIQRVEQNERWVESYPFYFNELATVENTLFAFPPIKRTVPITMTRITASITAYSAISWPSSFDQIPRKVFKIGPPKRHSYSNPDGRSRAEQGGRQFPSSYYRPSD